MKIVVDTNVVISGTFFGGAPRRIIEAIAEGKIEAYATKEIIDEYHDITDEMIDRKLGHLNTKNLNRFELMLNLVTSTTKIDVYRDPDDNKFLECAFDSKAIYIVSGDKDLLVLKKFNDIEIITASDFCNKYLF